jgi:hypothetical protein
VEVQEVNLSTPEELIRALNSLPSHYIFRGQANAEWKLESSLERITGDKWCSEEARRYEELSLARFQSKFHLYDRENTEPQSLLAWLSLMQHYGVPTRLIDFTDSPFVALYFAFETYKSSSKKDLSIFAIDYRAIRLASVAHIRKNDNNFQYKDEEIYDQQDVIFDKVIDPRAYEIAWVTEPKVHNVRLDRQGGCFLVSGSRDKRIQDVLDDSLYDDSNFIKYTIAAALHTNVFALLRKMNLTGKVLYGDLYGLAIAIRMEMEAYSSL